MNPRQTNPRDKPSSAPTSLRGVKKGRLEERSGLPIKAASSSHHIPPIPQTTQPRGALSATTKQRSLITQPQRDALHISAFGFNTQQGTRQTTGSSKLEKALHTTGSVEPIVTRSEKDSARFHLCVEALSEGCIQSYIHLFELSHRDPVCVDILSNTVFTISDEKLKWLQERLSQIEVLRRQSEFYEVFYLCQEVADYFEAERDLEEAIWHYEAALRYAQESLDQPLQLHTRHAYASFLERQNKFEEAAEMYDTLYTMAVAFKDEETAQSVSTDLARVYHTLGKQYSEGDPDRARQYFEKEALCAQRSSSPAGTGKALEALGRINERTGQLEKALQYHRSSRFAAHQENLLDDEVNAALNAAALEERLGYSEEAAKSLQEALGLAKKLGDPAKVCRASMQLGEVSRARLLSIQRPSLAEEESAMLYQTKCFEEAFEAACASGQQDLIDAARIAMGFARGEHYFRSAGNGKGYIPMVCNDVEAQLEWMSKGKL